MLTVAHEDRVKRSKKGIHILTGAPALRERLIRIFQNLSHSNQQPFPIEIILSLDDAKEIHLLFFKAVPERMDDSRREVAERTKVETEWSQFIDRANAPIFGVDSEGLVNEWNQTAERIPGKQACSTKDRKR